jgi:hypothetical protein
MLEKLDALCDILALEDLCFAAFYQDIERPAEQR